MNEILQFFQQIASSYGNTVAIMCLLIVLLIYGIRLILKAFPNIIQECAEWSEAKNKEKHVIANARRKNIAVDISKSLSDLTLSTNVNRALLFEFSNGSSNLAGLPFLFINATCESLNHGSDSIAYAYQRINVSLFADFISEIEEKSYFYAKYPEEIKETYPIMYSLFKQHNAGSVLFYAIYGINEIIGLVFVSVPKEKTFERSDVLPYVAETAQRISNLLNLENLNNSMN